MIFGKGERENTEEEKRGKIRKKSEMDLI